MDRTDPYLAAGVVLACLALYALVVYPNLLRKIIALNVLGAGVFLLLVGLKARSNARDPIPHALVLTGIVVSVATSGLAIAAARAVKRTTGRSDLSGDA